jgi:predicted nucleic acid-binding protein
MSDLPRERAAVVPDTSVIVKWYRQGEVLADRALSLRDAYLDGQIAISVPSLVAYELANVLRYKGDLTTEQVQTAVESLFDMGWEWVVPSSATMRRAVEIARARETTVYDAVFVALAESLGATYVTADRRLVRRLGDLSVVRLLGEVGDM